MIFLYLMLAGVFVRGADFGDMIAEVKSGKRSEACASWWGFDRGNATRCLQDAINSKVKKLIIDNTGHDWIIDSVQLVGNQEIVLAENVRIAARKNGYKGLNDTMFTAIDCQNLIIRGESGSEILMHKKDYQNKKEYKPSEWRHCIALLSCRDVIIRDLNIKSSGGDGIYVGLNKNSPVNYCQNILVENVVCDDHHRQGISVISAKNLMIRKSVFKNTQGTGPAAGVDFEPNSRNDVLENCVIEDCSIENNSGGGILVATAIDNPIDLKIRRCTIEGGSRGIQCMPPKNHHADNPGQVDIEDCRIINTTNSGIIVGNHPVSNYRINVKNCQLINSGTRNGITPISFLYTLKNPAALGNIHFENVSIKTIPDRQLCILKNWTPGVYLAEVTGILAVDDRKVDIGDYIKEKGFDKYVSRQFRELKLADLTAGNSIPAPSTNTYRIRNNFSIVLYGEAGKELSFHLTGYDLKRKPREINVKVTDLTGKIENLGKMAPGETKKFTFTPNQTGAYLLEAEIGPHMMSFKPETQFHWAMVGASSDGYINIYRPAGRSAFYFAVPAGLKTFEVEVSGDPGETVTAEIKSPNGKIVMKREHFDAPVVFTVFRESTEAEIWSITLSQAIEDTRIRILSPLLPLVSDNPANLLIGAQ